PDRKVVSAGAGNSVLAPVDGSTRATSLVAVSSVNSLPFSWVIPPGREAAVGRSSSVKGRCAVATPVNVAPVSSPAGLVTPPSVAVSAVPGAVPAGGENTTSAWQLLWNGAGATSASAQLVPTIPK